MQKLLILLALLPGIIFSQEKIHFGYSSGENPVVIIEKFSPLINYISKELNNRIEYVSTSSYLDVQEGFTKGSIDIGILNTISFIKLNNDKSIIPIAARVKNSSDDYRSYIIVKKDSSLQNYNDLKNKTFAMGDPYSTSATIMPTFLLYNAGLTPKTDLNKVIHFTKQDSILYAILNGTVDAGGIASFIFDEYDKKVTSLFRIIDKSDKFPLGPFVVKKDFSPELKDKLLSILLKINMSQEGRDALRIAGLESFKEFDISEYENINELYLNYQL